MRQEAKGCICPPETPACVCGYTPSLRLINKKVIIPSSAEVQSNPRSRSAKLRVAERLITQEEQYMTIEELCFSKEISANGWRRPAVLKKLQRTFATL